MVAGTAAEVSFIGPAVDPQRGTVEVKLRVPEPPDYLRAGMTVSVDVLVARRERALTVPRESVRQDERGAWVLVVREGRAVRQPVSLGLLGDARVELASGVMPGEAVLLNPGAVATGTSRRQIMGIFLLQGGVLGLLASLTGVLAATLPALRAARLAERCDRLIRLVDGRILG